MFCLDLSCLLKDLSISAIDEGYNRRQPYLLIEAAAIVDNLSEKCEQIVHILSIKEVRVRSLTPLNPDQQREVWLKAVQASGGKIPSGRVVKDIVQ